MLMLKKFSWVGVIFALLMALLPVAHAEDPLAKVPAASYEVSPALVLCNNYSGWSCWKQYRRFAGAASYQEFLAAARGVVVNKAGYPVGQAEIKNWQKHSYTKLLVLAPQVVVSYAKETVLPNAIKLTPVVEGSPLQFANLVHAEPPVPVVAPPVVVAKRVDPRELVSSLPLHERFTSSEWNMLVGTLVVLAVLLVLPWALYLSPRDASKKASLADSERKTPVTDAHHEHHHGEGCSGQCGGLPKFGTPIPPERGNST